MKTKVIGISLLAMTVATVLAYPSLSSLATTRLPTPTIAPTRAPTQARKVEVVFVLDTTSSMTGLIETAKAKIWSIATTLAQAEQSPDVSIGLVAFRDRGDAYVTETVDLSTDLDAMYTRLMQFVAAGGGDGPESVNQALYDAVHHISWSQDPSSYQVVFLVGDAPPHMDYQGEQRYPEIVRAAVSKGIVVNTIQCGEQSQTVAPWSQIASLGNGRYMRVGQSGDGFAVSTPYDEEIAQLAAELDSTRLVYGSEAQRQSLERRVEETMKTLGVVSVAEQASRGIFNATASGYAHLFGERDLVADVINGDVALEEVPEEELPASLRALAQPGQPGQQGQQEQRQAIDEIAARRSDIKSRIDALTKSRSAFIDEVAAESGADEMSLDRQIYETVREQAAPLGLMYEDGPNY